jgi:hypothetical protein
MRGQKLKPVLVLICPGVKKKEKISHDPVRVRAQWARFSCNDSHTPKYKPQNVASSSLVAPIQGIVSGKHREFTGL